MIFLFRSAKIGDTVKIDGHYTLIEDIGLTNTILRRWDWLRIVSPMLSLDTKSSLVKD